MAVVLLGACALLGALLGMAATRARTGLLVLAGAVIPFLVFMPGTCVTAIASAPLGDPEQLRGQTSCDTFYGAALPELGALEADLTGRLLTMAAAALAASATVLVKRCRAPRSPSTAPGTREMPPPPARR